METFFFFYQLATRTTVGKVAALTSVSETSRAGHSIFRQDLTFNF